MIAWLDDAYAMERQQLLPSSCDRAVAAHAGVDVRSRIEEHVYETEGHVERLREALSSLGSRPSKAGQNIASLSRIATSVATSESGTAVHHAVASYAAEQFEVATYTALIAAAEHVGEVEVARLCRLNRGEDEDMAEWLEARIAILISDVFAPGQHP